MPVARRKLRPARAAFALAAGVILVSERGACRRSAECALLEAHSRPLGSVLCASKKEIDVDINLETLKTEILDYLGQSEFAVFRSHSGGLEGLPVITWDSERFPDYRMFLDVATKIGQKLILFASREFDDAEIEEALEELEDADLTRDEQRDYERRIRSARSHVGSACSLEIAFDFNSHLYVYEARPDWYEDFLEACDEITSLLPVTDDGESGPDGLGGFYSNN